MSVLKKLFGRKKAPDAGPKFEADLNPDEPLFVIGDIHGCADLLDALLQKQPKGSQMIFVGDLIDRGPQSSKVLEIAQAACTKGAICLAGNHEAMMIDFLDRPTERGPRWLRFGGLQTLESLRVGGLNERSDDTELLKGRDLLQEALGDDTLAWLRTLPTSWKSGNVHIVHAAADPELAMEDQEQKVKLWGHPNFENVNRSDGQWVVYGHDIKEEAHAHNGRIAIDTGAYATGKLSAAYISNGTVEFITA